MRPRGLSSSSPSSTKVGQVAVQKPQCTQVRSTWLLDWIAGSRSCSAVKLVCMRLTVPRTCRPGLRMPMRVHRRLDPARDAGQRRRLRRDHVDRGAHAAPAPRSSVQVPPAAPRAAATAASCSPGAPGDPDQPAAPIQKAARRQPPASASARRARRTGAPRRARPHRPARCRSGTASRTARQTACARRVAETGVAAQLRAPAGRGGKRRCARNPRSAPRATAPPPGQLRHALGRLGRQEGRRRTRRRASPARRDSAPRRRPRLGPGSTRLPRQLRRGQHLQRDLGQHRQACRGCRPAACRGRAR